MTDPVPAQHHSSGGDEIPSTANDEAAHGSISENSVTATLGSIDALLVELEEKQRSSAAQLEQTQKARDELFAKLKSVEAELAQLKAVRDAESKEKQAALEKLSAQAAQLDQTQKARDEQAAKLKSVEGELAQLKAGREKTVATLQRVRRLARSAG